MNNIIERVWTQNKMVKIEDLQGMAFQAEASGHTFRISGVDGDGNVIPLSGTVSGVFLRPDNTDVAITGAASGGVVSVTLPAECYDVPGRFGLTVYVSANGEKTAVYAAMGTVSRTTSGTVSPGTVGDVVDLINRINAAVQTIPASWSGLMADIAPNYSDTAVYPVGAYVYYNGDLYRSITAITTAETWTAAHWTAAVLGNDVSDLKSAFEQLVDDTIDVSVGKNRCPSIFYDGYLESDGSITQYSDWKTTDFIDVSGYDSFLMTAAKTNNDRTNITAFFLTTYDTNKTLIERVGDVSSQYTVGTGVAYIRFSFHGNTYHDIMVKGVGTPSGYEPYKLTYKAVNADYALKSELSVVSDAVEVVSEKTNELDSKFEELARKDYQVYNPDFSLSPSAIENNGVLIDTLTNTKTTDYIDCSDWIGIRYTGSSWLVCRALAFYDENHGWIKSYPDTGDTTEYVNEIISIPSNAKYVIFADLTKRQTQTLKIEVAEEYKIAGKWTGKKWACVGDSLTEHNLRTTMNYHDYVADATGITVVNMGRSGTGYKRTYDEGYAFYQRIVNVPTDSDVVTIFGSGNDLLYADNIGTPTDTFNTEDEANNSLCACINHTIDVLIGLMPTVQLGIVAPTPWKGEKPTLNNTNSMGQYVEALRQICYIRSIPFLDLYHESNLRPWTEEGRNACYSKDGSSGVHPDEAGHKIISSRFEGFLDTLLLGN